MGGGKSELRFLAITQVHPMGSGSIKIHGTNDAHV